MPALRCGSDHKNDRLLLSLKYRDNCIGVIRNSCSDQRKSQPLGGKTRANIKTDQRHGHSCARYCYAHQPQVDESA